ncbi:putative quinol monooxygenase [Iodidimonas sp. SYSU 1G8]|jgi:quinol monooxygenase YgiN|uniref:putative quinol monooxygenase n=1 Tax=Iodidimonas sp. SYSU 1G8 TaxID=3133967 RepID=UPI0031FE46DE
MLSQIVKVRVKPGKEMEFAAVSRTMSGVVEANEPDTLVYKVFRTEDPLEFIVIEIYKDEAALQAHRDSAHVAAVLPRLGGVIDGAPEIGKYEEVVL